MIYIFVKKEKISIICFNYKQEEVVCAHGCR